MNGRRLGRTGLLTGEVGLGTWAFSSMSYGDVRADDAVQAVRTALDAGVTFFDTAPLYGTTAADGIAEELLGQGLAGRRHEVLVATKFGRRMSTQVRPMFTGEEARQSVDASLRRLGTERIDVLFLHSPFSPDEVHDDVWEALADIRTEGKVGYVGHSISHLAATGAMAEEWASDGRIDVVQVAYSLLNRQAEPLLERLGAAGVGIVVREALANGYLSGRVTRDTVFPPNHVNARHSRDDVAARVAYVERLGFLVRPPATGPAQAALRWVLDNPSVSVVLAGATNPAEVVDSAQASELAPFSEEDHHRAAALHEHDFDPA